MVRDCSSFSIFVVAQRSVLQMSGDSWKTITVLLNAIAIEEKPGSSIHKLSRNSGSIELADGDKV